MLKEIEKTLRSHPFVTPKFLQNYHTQIFGHKIVPYFKTKLPKPERVFIKLTDGSQIGADCFFQPNKSDSSTIVVMNGFTSSSKSFFSKTMCNKAYFYGFNVILLMQRAEGDTVRFTKSLFSGYSYLDLPIALETFHNLGLKDLYLVGLSFGGYAVLSTLGYLGKKANNLIHGAVGISNALSVVDTWKYAENNPFYSWLLLQGYKHTIRKRAKVDPPGTWNLKELKSIKNYWQFFEKYHHTHTWSTPEKVSSIEEYDRKTDIKPWMKNISVPTLFIAAKDDPILPIDPHLSSDIQNNPNIITLLTNHGGHGGFFTLKPKYGDLDGHWAQNRAMEFIRLLEKTI